MKKKFFLLSFFIITISVCLFLFFESSEYIAGEYRYYTYYEKLKSNDKTSEKISSAYDSDKYRLKRLKNEIDSLIGKFNHNRKIMFQINDSINLYYNSSSDYDRYNENIEDLILTLEQDKTTISFRQNDLLELYNFISKMERELFSIYLYKNEINDIHTHIDNVLLKIDDYKVYLNSLQINATYKNLALIEQKIIEEKLREEEIIEKYFRIKEEYAYSKYENTINNTFNYNNVDNYRTSITYQTPLNATSFSSSVPGESTYPSTSTFTSPTPVFYSPNTNPVHVEVKGHYRNGKYVEPYIRTAPNKTINDNFSTSPNINPYTGKKGTRVR